MLRKNLCSRKLNENGANSRAILRLSGRRQNRDCSRNCNCQSLQEPQTSTDFNDRHATGSISISYKPQLSTDFNNLWNLVRDQGVGGSNPLSPANVLNNLSALDASVDLRTTGAFFDLRSGLEHSTRNTTKNRMLKVQITRKITFIIFYRARLRVRTHAS